MRVAPTLLVLSLLAIPLAMPAPAALAAGTTFAFDVFPATGGLGAFAGEPSLGYEPHTGNVLFQAGTQTLRVAFDDSVSPPAAKWTDVTPAQTSVSNNDPILATDPSTGRTFAGGLDGDCSILASTDDAGVTWNPVGNACASPAFDHETIASGPWHGAKPAGATSDRAVYYCADEAEQECAVSWDGGVTFLPPAAISPTLTCAGLMGHVKIAPDGTAYVPSKGCGGKVGVMSTTNNGLSWSTHVLSASSVAANGFDPSVAVTPSSFVYAAWEGADNHLHVALSKNAATTWTAPVDVTGPAGIQTAIFPAAVAGDDGRVAVAFVGTPDAGNAMAQGFQGSWYLYVAASYDSGQTWTVAKATSDPVQRGWVCNSGVSCPTDTSNSSGQSGRNLLDFIDATMDAQGHVLVAFADGCVGDCALANGTVVQSTAMQAALARQDGGQCLLAASACGAASSAVIPAAYDDQCSSRVVIFSSNSLGTPSLNSHALVCLAEGFAGAPGLDTAIINPGSDRVSVRYTQDAGASGVYAIVDGLGVHQLNVTMARSVSTTGSVTYDTPQIRIDGTASGSITATVHAPDGTVLGAVRFHTLT